MTLVPHRYAFLRVCLLFLVGWFLLAHPASSAESVNTAPVWRVDQTFGSTGHVLYNPVPGGTATLHTVNMVTLRENTTFVDLGYSYLAGKGGGYASKSVMFTPSGVPVEVDMLPDPVVGVQSDGKYITAYANRTTHHLTLHRYTTALTIDPTFTMTVPLQPTSDRPDWTFDVSVQPDDTVLVYLTGKPVLRLTPNGVIDPSFTHPVGPFEEFHGFVSHPNGSFLVSACTVSANECAAYLYRHDGAYVTTLVTSSYVDTTLDDFVAAPVSDGGWVWTSHEDGGTRISRSTRMGILDRMFGIDGTATFRPSTMSPLALPVSLAVQADGSVLVAGMLENSTYPVVGRLMPNGMIDPSFNSHAILMIAANPSSSLSEFRQIAVQPNGKIVLAAQSPQGLRLTRITEVMVRGRVLLPITMR